MNSLHRGLTFALTFAALSIGFTNCSPVGTTGGTIVAGPSVLGANVMAVTVGCEYPNEPCVSVTICTPGTTSCQTINNVLLDTGSYGLRLFSQAISVSLTNEADPTHSGNTLAECVSYGDGSADWGPISHADVVLGTEKASNVPIQIIQSTFSTSPASCTGIETTPSASGFNGILGVGLFIQDCGASCTTSASNGVYYTCTSSSCTGATVALTLQTTNPVSMLPADNNGVILELPGVPSSGATTATGSLIFGIGTQTNNTPGTVAVFPASKTTGTFTTVYKGSTLTGSFIDSGSNGLFFPDSTITQCTGNESGLFCPTSELNLTAVQKGTGVSNTIAFPVGNAANEFATTNANMVFPDLGGPITLGFDWGLPFFLGRSVYVGFASTTSTLGAGPLWAY